MANISIEMGLGGLILLPFWVAAIGWLTIGFSMREGSVIARAVRHLVGDDRSDMRVLERDLSLLLGETRGAGISPAVLSGVLDVMEGHGLRPPRTLLLLSRTLLTFEGTLKQFDPDFDLPTAASDLVVRDRLGDLGTPEEVLRRELVRALPALRTLPVRDACWVLGFSGLTAATTLLLRTVAQSLHARSVRGDWPAEPD